MKTYAFASITFFLVLAFTCPTSRAQNLNRLRVESPTVFITFESFDKRQPLSVNEGEDGVYFRLHNNTSVAINLCTQGFYSGPFVEIFSLTDGRKSLGLRENAKVTLCYGLRNYVNHAAETVLENTSRNKPADVIKENNLCGINTGYIDNSPSSSAWLPSGKSILFSIPRKNFTPEYFLYLSFKFEWEFSDGKLRNQEPEHIVKFYYAQLPKN